jgi:predicted nucleic acid-binding protein
MVLVDTSVWIDYFAGEEKAGRLSNLLDTNHVCINDLILAEIIPSINLLKEFALRDLLLAVQRLDLVVDWNQLILMQTMNLKNGINKVGIPDLIIAQNAIEHDVALFANDRHFQIMSTVHPLRLYE